MRRIFALATLAAITFTGAQAQENFESWPLLKNPFESTSGGGVMIDGYDPVVANGKCTTDFTVKLPDGVVLKNEIVFDAVPMQGGILCNNGQWKSKDGTQSGTTPFRVFIKDGVRRASAS